MSHPNIMNFAPEDPTPPASRGWGKLVLGAVGGIVIGAVVASAVFLTGLVGGGSESEGPGFDTPEAAAEAYVTAIRDGDLDAMVRAHAVESFAAQCDFGAYLERLRAYIPYGWQDTCPFPAEDEVGAAANVLARTQSVETWSLNAMAMVFSPRLLDDGVLQLEDESAVSEFLSEIEDDFSAHTPDRLDDIAAVSPSSLTELHDADANERGMELLAAAAGLSSDNYVEVAITFTLDGEEYGFAPAVGRYQGRWYLTSPWSTLSMLMGASSATGIFALER